MKINELNISSFGKFNDKKVSLSDKVNVIYGNNESGKTTLLSFIRYMLYGLNGRKSVNNITFEEKYLPWNNSALSGSMEFEKDDSTYLISRSNGIRKEVSVINSSTGENAFEGVVPGESLYGVNESAFLRTYYFSGSTCEIGTDKNDDIIKSLTNLVETGDEALSYSAACSKINSDKKTTAEKLSRLENDILLLRKKLERISMLKQKKSDLENKIKDESYSAETTGNSGNEDLQQLIEKQSLLKLYQQAKIIIFVLLLIISVVMFVLGHTILGLIITSVYAVVVALMLRSKRKLRLITHKINKLTYKLQSSKSELFDKSYIYKELGAVEAELENEFSYEDICSQIDCLENEKQNFQYKIKVLEKAKTILDESYSQMKNMFSPLLNKRVSEIFSRLTCSEYSDILVMDDFGIKIMGDYDYKNSKMYSMSVYESLYLSLRLALCDIFDGDDKMPVFLDDSFISYDDKKAECAVKYIKEYSDAGRQVIICTCHKREFELLSQIKDVSIINLNIQ